MKILNLSLIIFINIIINAIHTSSIFPVSPSLKNSLMGAIQDYADFAIRIHPPEEETDDILSALDQIKLMEQDNTELDMEEYARRKQEMLNLHKARIQKIISTAFEPILTTLEEIKHNSL